MMAADSLHVAVPLLVPSGVSFCWQMLRCWPCHRVHSVNASALHLALPSNVQTSCLERARPLAIGAFAGERAASSTAPPGRRCPERSEGQRRKARQKGAAPGRPQSQSAHGGNAARSGFAAVPRGARGPRQSWYVRVLSTTAYAAAYWEHSHD